MKRNDNQYVIRWSHQKDLPFVPVPSTLVPHLRTTFQKHELYPVLRPLIKACPLNDAQTALLPTRAINHSQPCAIAPKAPPAATLPAGSLDMSSLSSSGRSEMSMSQGSKGEEKRKMKKKRHNPQVKFYHDNENQQMEADNPRSPTGTQKRTGQPRLRLRGYDSDDDVTVGDDAYDLDVYENFWRNQLKESRYFFQRNEDEDDLGADDPGALPSTDTTDTNMADHFDVASLLQNCTDFGFTEVSPDEAKSMLPQPKIYDQPFRLKRGVAASIFTPLDAFRRSGFTEELVATWTQNSNKWYEEYFAPKHLSINREKWHGLKWQPISVDEMHRFLGIMLRISVNREFAEGYSEHFRESDMVIKFSDDPLDQVTISDSKGFVSKVPDEFRMSLNRFKQIRSAFHTEDKSLANESEDKSYMLRSTMNALNAASLANFVPESSLAFDEACRSRFCPIRQCQKDKPDRYPVDFFILEGTASQVVYHVDVYQGENPANVGIAPELVNLPTRMKAVLNAVVQSKVSEGSDDMNGYRILSLDNRFQCPRLAYMLWHRYQVLSVGICKSNMIGWPKDIMTLTRGKRSRGQGSYKMAVSKEYGVAAFQWKEPSVVNCVSSYLDFRTSEVEYVVESSRESVPCPAALVYYQEDMGRVDKVDHMRMADFRGFATVGHYQKWYKKALMAVLHLMLINGFHLWNSIAEKNPNMRVLEWYKYVRIVANKLMRFKGNA